MRRSRLGSLLLLALALSSCSDWNLRRNREDPDTGRDVAECEDASRGSVAVADPVCERKLGPFDYKVKWNSDEPNLTVASMVMPLFDENGDGRVTSADGNHVLAVERSGYVALRGGDGTLAARFNLGDGDSARAAYLHDGVAYVMGYYGRYRLPTGEMEVPWWNMEGWATPSHADIDGDGHLETATGRILDDNGTVLGEGPRPKYTTTTYAFFANERGEVRVVTPSGVIRVDGSADCVVEEGNGIGMWADLLGNGRVTLVIPWAGTDGPGILADQDCQVYETPSAGDGWTWWKLYGTTSMSPALIPGRAAMVGFGVRDGRDGERQIKGFVVDMQDGLRTEFDRPLSMMPTADFDGDGVHEVVAIYQGAVRVIDGRDGAVRMELPYAAWTIPVDVDRDGALDLVAYTPDGVTVYEGGSAPWARSTMTWQSEIHYPGYYRSDGTTAPPNEWNRLPWYNAAGDDGYRTAVGADLAVTILDVCEVECETGTLDVTVQPANHGVAALEVPVRVRLFGKVAGQETLLDEVVVPSIPAGTKAETVVLRVREPVLPSELRADIVPDGWLFEGCDEVPDEDRWEEAFCAGR